MREYHVRICEGLGVKFPGSTRQKRTLRRVSSMSALHPKADIRAHDQYVRFVPKADIGVSFDDFVGTGRYCPRDFDIKRIGRA